jgi:hypothetical protein
LRDGEEVVDQGQNEQQDDAEASQHENQEADDQRQPVFTDARRQRDIVRPALADPTGGMRNIRHRNGSR